MTFISIFIFLLPYLILGYHSIAQSGWSTYFTSLSQTLSLHGSDLSQVLFTSTLQSFISSLLILILGLTGALGLLSLKESRYFTSWRLLIMSPALLPSAFATISGINFYKTLGFFSYGFWGVVALHVLLYSGLAAVLIERAIRNSFSGAIELATVEGAGFWILLKVVLSGLRSEIVSVAFLFVTLTLTSFSVPLIVGAQSGMTLEVLIYKSILSRGDLSFAFFVSLVQLGLIYFFSYFFQSRQWTTIQAHKNHETLSCRPWLYFFSAVSLFLILFNARSFIQGTEIFMRVYNNDSASSTALLMQIFGTVVHSSLAGFFVLILMIGLLFLFQNAMAHRLLLGYTTPSVTLIGFAVYLIFDSQQLDKEIVYALMAGTFVITLLPTLYRLRLSTAYQALLGQVQMAKVLGASHRQVVFEILLPQLGRDVFFLCGLAAFWASGDFALSSIVTGQELTLGLVLKNLMGGYHLELSTVYGFISIAVGLAVFAFFEGCGRVFDTKFNSSLR